MKKSLVVVLTAGALMSATMAWAAPRALSSVELDKVAAGSGVMDWVFGGSENNTPVLGVADNGALNVVGDENSIPTASAEVLAVAGEENVAAAQDSIAIEGDENQANTGEGNANLNDIDDSAVALGEKAIAINDTEYSAIAIGTNNAAVSVDGSVDYGAAVVAGDNNTVTAGYENTFDNEYGFSVYGNGNDTVGIIDNDDSNVVVAQEASISDSFNRKEIDIDVTIRDSFNVTTKTLDVSGQNGVTAIVLANTLGEQMVGVNLNVTSATATIPNSTNFNGVPGAEIGNAYATTNLVQTVINNSILVLDKNFQVDIEVDFD